ncbi:MAG TPA: response regulator [Telluria sp.]|nr:response regulator [Telluria sp.]
MLSDDSANPSPPAGLHQNSLDYRDLLRLFEQAPGFVCFFRGPQHIYELQNQAHHRLAEFRDIIGKPVREALPELAGQGFFELLDDVFQSGVAFVGEALPLAVVPPAGGAAEQRYIDFVYQPIVDDQGARVGIFSQGSDVTERVLAQRRLHAKQEELEQMVEQRSAALAEVQEALKLTQELQGALNRSHKLEAIGQLTGGVAHDFNNILQVIGGNLQLLQTTVPEGRGARHLESALQAVQRGAKLSSQLLAYARRQPLQPIVINPARAVADMDEMLRRVLGENIEIEMVKAGGLWNTIADPHQLENVLLNLAINARDAMANGGKLTIEIGNAMLDDDYVALEPDMAPGQYVMFAISDTGIGMSADTVERACEPFFTTKPEGHGTGLGLSMAYGFVKQTGGHLKIYSEPGHGTTVKLYFPRSFEAEAQLAPVDGDALRGGEETVLVVEDDLAVQATVVEMLGSMGYRVLKADNADSALGILKSGLPIDLLFTDVVMPGALRSPELARLARALHPGIAVLFTSGYTQNAIVHGGRLDPGVELLSKPYGREQLARKVRSILASRPAPAQAPAATGKRILLVEDNAELLDMTCELLRQLGHDVNGAASGEDALLLLREKAFEVLLTDLQLPGCSGIELARKARSMQPRLRVIVASGYGAPPAGSLDFAFEVLAKPYGLEQLRAMLERGLGEVASGP